MKKHISLLLVLAMLICVLAGCGSGTAPAETTAAATQAAVATAAAEATDSEGWPAIGTPDAPVTVKVVCKDVFPDEEDVVSLVAAINEKMAAHGQYVNVEFVDPPSSSYKTAMPLAVMNGEVDADLIYFQGGDEAVSAQGLLEDLTPYIESSTYVKELMNETNVEKMKNYPYLLWLAPPRVSTPGIRTDLAKQCDSYEALIADPTVDNYYRFF